MRTVNTIREQYADSPDFRRAFADLYALRSLFFSGIDAAEEDPPVDFVKSIVPSNEGAAVLERLSSVHGLEPSEAHFVLFLLLYHTDLLLDVEATDRSSIAAYLSKRILQRQIQYPYLFERILYEKAFETLTQS